MRGLVIALLVCAPAVASAQSVDLKGWTTDGKAVVDVNPGAGAFDAGAWAESVQGASFEAVCTPQALASAELDGGDAGCALCADDQACGLSVDASSTKSSLKSPNKKIKVKDKRSCAKDPDEYTGKSCSRKISFGKLGSFTYPEQWSDDKAPMKVFFRPDSGAALVTFFGANRMDTTNVSMYVVDLGGGASASASAGAAGGQAQMLCGIVEGDQVTAVVPDKKKPKIADVVKCAVRETGGDGDKVTVQTSWGKGRQGPAHTTDVAVGSDAEIDLSPVVSDQDQPDFVPCVDFQIDAKITSKSGDTVWSQTVNVPQKCKTPKAKFECTLDDGAGKQYDELKKQYRLPDDATMACSLYSVSIPDGGDAWLEVRNSQGVQKVAWGGGDVALDFDVPASMLAECDSSELDVVVTDSRHIPVFTKTVTLTENCPD